MFESTLGKYMIALQVWKSPLHRLPRQTHKLSNHDQQTEAVVYIVPTKGMLYNHSKE